MKKNNLSFQKLVKKIRRQKTSLQPIQLIQPTRDWNVGLLSGLVMVAALVGWSAYVYFDKREAISLDSEEMEIVVPIYKAEIVEKALDIFQQRADTYNLLTQNRASTVEPVTAPEVENESKTTIGTTTQPAIELINQDAGTTGQEDQPQPTEQPVFQEIVPTLVE